MQQTVSRLQILAVAVGNESKLWSVAEPQMNDFVLSQALWLKTIESVAYRSPYTRCLLRHGLEAGVLSRRLPAVS